MSIGKRKRSVDDDSDKNAEDDELMRARFQRAFEAKFKPLDRSAIAPPPSLDENGSICDGTSETSDWSGVSDDEDEHDPKHAEDAIETIDHTSTLSTDHDLERSERKAFMSSRPPVIDTMNAIRHKILQKSTDPDSSEAINNKNDIALQRLLKESHLLDPGSFKSDSSTQSGSGRLKALDLRLKDLGAKESLAQQQKMPLSHRKGIVIKAASRETKRRDQAVENGVVLEKVRHASGGKRFREKGVGGPAVGRMKGATLKISSRDLRSIQGPPPRQGRTSRK